MWLKGNPLHLNRGNTKRILMIQLGDIGDVVLSLHCIRALKEHFASSQVVVAVWAKARDLIEECPWADDVICVEKPNRGLPSALAHHYQFLRRLRKFHFDVVIDLRTGTRGAVMTLLTGAKLRIGYHTYKETFWRNWIFTHLKPFIPDPDLHQSKHYQSLLQQCGVEIPDGYPQIKASSTSRQKAGQLFMRHGISTTEPIIALHPFALWRYKEWPNAKSAELARRLTNDFNLTIVVLGTALEHDRAQTIVDHCDDHGHVVNLAGETDLRVLPAVLQRCQLLIGMDSACGHVAAAVATPCISIFGPGKAGVWAPLGERNRIVRMPLPCIHCGQKGCDDREQSKCLEELAVEEVFSAVKDHLQFLGSHLSGLEKKNRMHQ